MAADWLGWHPSLQVSALPRKSPEAFRDVTACFHRDAFRAILSTLNRPVLGRVSLVKCGQGKHGPHRTDLMRLDVQGKGKGWKGAGELGVKQLRKRI